MRAPALLLLSAALLGHADAQARPEPAGFAGQSVGTMASAAGELTEPRRFDIPAQALPDALAEFARQAEVRVVVRTALRSGARSNAVHGDYDAAGALRILLEGTGHAGHFTASHTAVIGLVGADASIVALDTVIIIGRTTGAYRAVHATSATKSESSLRETPQSITVVSRELIADQAMQNMADVVRVIPGVTMGQGEGHRDAPTIRGNSSTADFFVDGVRDDVQYFRDLYNVERVEGLKGANAMIFGRGGGGGVINRVTKGAQWQPVRALTLSGSSYGGGRGTLDLGQGVGSSMAARVNAMYEKSDQFRDAVRLERFGITPTATLALRPTTTLRVAYELFDDHRTVDRGIPSFGDRPSHAPVDAFFGDPDASYADARVHAAGVTLDHATEAGLTLRSHTRFARYDKFYQNVYPRGVSASGDQVTLGAYNNATARDNLFTQLDLTVGAWTGAVRHRLLLGAELGRQETDNRRETGHFGDSATVLAVPFGTPTVSTPVTFRPSASDAENRVTAGVVAVYAQDQLTLTPRVRAVVGVRFERFDLRHADLRNGEVLRRDDAMVSPRVGLVVDPATAVSLYGSYGVSYLPSAGDQFSSLTATSRALKPERFDNYEVGAKWDVRSGFALSAAAYLLDRSNTSARDPNAVDRLVQTGSQRTMGLEVSGAGRLTDRWSAVAAWTVQGATITRSTVAAPDGARVPLVPRQALSLWNRIQVARTIGLGLGVIRQSDMYAAIDNTVTLPAFTRVDGAVIVALTDEITAQANVENVLDARYYPTSHGNDNIMPGAPRTVRVSLSTAF